MTRRREYAKFIGVGVITALFLLILPDISTTAKLIAVAAAVAFLGLPHGAIDAYIAQRCGLWATRRGLAVFAGVYLFLAAGVTGIWMLAPVTALAVFLAISAWHFGSDGGATGIVERLAFGALFISLPALFHPDEVASLFAALSGQDARQIAIGLQSIAPFAIACTIISILVREQASSQKRADIVLAFSLILFAMIFSPLVYFAVYFCALHSPRHFGKVMTIAPQSERRRAILHATLFTSLALLIAAVSFAGFQSQFTLQETMIRVVFVGLAALTVPHMILIDGVCRSNLSEFERKTR